MKTRDRTLLNTVFSSVGIYTEYFLGLFAAIMVARHLGPAGYGTYGLFMWLVSIGIAVTNSGITTGAIKFIAELRGGERSDLIVATIGYLRRVQRLHMAAALAVSVLAYFAMVARLKLPMDRLEFALLVVSMAMRAAYMLNVSVAKGFEAFDATAKISLVAAPLNLAMVGAAMLLNGSIFAFVVVYALSSVAFLAVSHVQVVRLTKGLPKHADLPAELLQRMRHHLRVVSATVIINFFLASDVEILFLTAYDGPAAAGYFKVSYQLATGVALLVPGVFGALLLPMMAKALSHGRAAAGRRFVAVTNYLALLAVPVVAFGVCFSAPIIMLLYGASYAAAVPVFALIVFTASLGTTLQGASSLLVSADRQRTILLLTIVFGVLRIAMDLVLIERFGLHGAMAAILASSLIGSATYAGIGMRVGGARLEWGRLGRIVLAGIAAALAALPVLALHWPPIFTILAGGAAVVAVYLPSTLLLGCWSSGDVEQIQGLHMRLSRGRPRALGLLLGWARERAVGRG